MKIKHKIKINYDLSNEGCATLKMYLKDMGIEKKLYNRLKKQELIELIKKEYYLFMKLVWGDKEAEVEYDTDSDYEI